MAHETGPPGDSVGLPADRSAEPGNQRRVSADGGAERRLMVFERAAPRAIEWVTDGLVAGQVIAFPTDTVYALAASLAHRDALRRIFDLKQRKEDQPLPILLSGTDMLAHVAMTLDERLAELTTRYWPGPLTVAVPAREGMPPEVLGPGGTVGARVPNHFLALELIERAGGAIAATSANRSGEPPARTADDVVATFGNDLDLLLDGGTAPGGVASTVIAVHGTELTILRPGAIPESELIQVWHAILADLPRN